MIPVTVLTGFLGAGKTTLLNRILTEQHGRKIAVIENEFGEVGVDNHLVIRADEEIFAMNNGCICCTVRGDLLRILRQLAQREQPVDAVLIETTGLADPGPVAQTFFTDPDIRARYRLDAIVTLVDVRHIAHHWDESDEAKKQIAFADVILLNKTDLVTPPELATVENRVRQMNPAARLHRTQQAAVDPAHVLDVGGFNLDRAHDLDPRFLEPEYPFEWGGVYEVGAEPAALHLGAGPDPSMDVVLLPVADTGEAALAAAREAAVLAFSEREPATLPPGKVLPADGKLHQLELTEAPVFFPLGATKPGRYALFTQHHPDEFGADVQAGGKVCSAGWSHAFKPDHEHDEAVASVGLSFVGELDAAKLNAWLSELLRTRGVDIFRSKGVLAVRGQPRRLVFQGIHMLFDSQYDRPWGTDEPRTNTFVFIGRALDREALTEGFARCRAD